MDKAPAACLAPHKPSTYNHRTGEVEAGGSRSFSETNEFKASLGWATVGLEQNKTVHCEHLSFGCLSMHLIFVVYKEVTTIVHSKLVEAQRQ